MQNQNPRSRAAADSLLVFSLCEGAASVTLHSLTGTMREMDSFSAKRTTGHALENSAVDAQRSSPLASLW